MSKAKTIFTELLSVSYPSLPFFKWIPEGVNVGTVVYIEGFAPQMCTKFTIDLIDGPDIEERTWKHSDIPFGMCIMFEDKLFIGNTRRDGEWGQPYKEIFTAIRRGDNFQMKIIVEEKYYKVIINGKSIVYQHRMNTDRAKQLRIEGSIVIKRIEFRHGNDYHFTPLDCY
ncbi:unnamed protein product [Medioppia subpectinata]|uniref:Galectin n=1 Tax=Medioppia subpectinata TaxID=1979941 RepID=A0A7R9KLN4_9ACAR|nr:unnamed protein product [Medioppia subpectinata]CAG2104775.1 unnamed protein product [Medioppia subpectinata]